MAVFLSKQRVIVQFVQFGLHTFCNFSGSSNSEDQ